MNYPSQRLMIPVLLLLAAVVTPSLMEAAATARSSADNDNALTFTDNFRAVVDLSGIVIPDEGLWDVGPAPGEVAYWARFQIRLSNVPRNLLVSGKEGGRFTDQYGGMWTVKRLEVLFRNDQTSCEKSGQNQRCYFLVPDFGGYRTDVRTYEAHRIVGLISREERANIRADAAARWEAGRPAREKAEHERIAAGRLLPHEIPGTPMYFRLKTAIASGLTPDAVAAWQSLSNHDKLDCRHRVVSEKGQWTVIFELRPEDQFVPKLKEPKVIAVLPGKILEQAEFGLNPEKPDFMLGSAILNLSKTQRIEGADRWGIPTYAVNRAFGDALDEAASALRSRKTLDAAERIRSLFSPK